MTWTELEGRAVEGDLAKKAKHRHDQTDEEFRSMNRDCEKTGMHKAKTDYSEWYPFWRKKKKRSV